MASNTNRKPLPSRPNVTANPTPHHHHHPHHRPPFKTHLCHCHVCRQVHFGISLCCRSHGPAPRRRRPHPFPHPRPTRGTSTPPSPPQPACSAPPAVATSAMTPPNPPPDSPAGVPEWAHRTSLFLSSAQILGSHIYPPPSRPSPPGRVIPTPPAGRRPEDDPTFPPSRRLRRSRPGLGSGKRENFFARNACVGGNLSLFQRPPDIALGAGAD